MGVARRGDYGRGEMKDGGPAFPLPMSLLETGMSLRDWFAGMAIPLASRWEEQAPTYTTPEPSYRGIAERAYFLSDAMLAERDKRTP